MTKKIDQNITTLDFLREIADDFLDEQDNEKFANLSENAKLVLNDLLLAAKFVDTLKKNHCEHLLKTDSTIALDEAYMPRHDSQNSCEMPKTYEGCWLTIMDKMDDVVGFMLAGINYNGSKDPYKLRQKIMDVFKILHEDRHYYPTLLEVFDLTLNTYRCEQNLEEGIFSKELISSKYPEMLNFIWKRFIGYILKFHQEKTNNKEKNVLLEKIAINVLRKNINFFVADIIDFIFNLYEKVLLNDVVKETYKKSKIIPNTQFSFFEKNLSFDFDSKEDLDEFNSFTQKWEDEFYNLTRKHILIVDNKTKFYQKLVLNYSKLNKYELTEKQIYKLFFDNDRSC